MKELFCPSSVVVIGVSTRPMNLGKEIARNLFEFRFTGVIHLVGTQGGIMFGRRIHTSLDEITEPVDLAVILTPARSIPDMLEQCGRKGIRRAIIESGGFGELDEEGKELGAALQRIARTYGMRFIGPNCIGIMNASNGLVTPFTTMQNVFRRGSVGIIAQSGGVALSFLNMFDGEQLGYSKFAAIGNKLDIDENDVLEYFVEDPETDVVCLYLESVNDGRRLTDIARRSPKPIVVHKANIGSLSRYIAQSHTEALANDDQVLDAAFRQAGIVRYQDMQNYLHFVKILQLPQMKGRNLAIVSRSGGHAVMAADAAYLYKFNLPPFGEDFLSEIRKHLRADVIRLSNPLDLGDLFDFDVYVRIIEHTIQQDNIDGILFLHTYFSAIEGEASRKLLQSAADLSHKYAKPVAMSVSTEQFELSRLHKEFDFPIFMSPERAVLALDTSIAYHRHRDFLACNHRMCSPQPPPDDEAIAASISATSRENRSPVLHEALHIIGAAGLSIPEYRVFRDPDRLAERVAEMPGPYAVKVIAQAVSHKSDVGGVVLGLSDPNAVQAAATDMFQRFGSSKEAGLHGVLVQPMLQRTPGTLELIVGGKRDPHFGPVVLLGHGGILVELFQKTSIRIAPLSEGEIEQMIDDLPGSEILRGLRGRPPVDREALKDAIGRVAHLMVRFPEISSIDINPVLVSPASAQCLDARIVLSA
ncbi:MAG TPA: acetate--CoA ligase family protein [Desulfomonilaceae bacterium]|nr:acetate--CoA ligase family protein [Desulfomonilaceae bacterium]